MSKASRKNKKGIKFYFLDKRSRGGTIRTIYAESEEEAKSKVTESGSQFVPVPGTLQYGNLIRVVNKEDFE